MRLGLKSAYTRTIDQLALIRLHLDALNCIKLRLLVHWYKEFHFHVLRTSIL